MSAIDRVLNRNMDDADFDEATAELAQLRAELDEKTKAVEWAEYILTTGEPIHRINKWLDKYGKHEA